MDLAVLQRLSEHGFAVVPADRLAELRGWCDDWALNTGEARYSVIADAFGHIDREWGEQGIPAQLVSLIEEALRDDLRDALDAATLADGAYFAGRFRSRIYNLPWEPHQWEAEGWTWTIASGPPTTAPGEIK